jgi:hypothetical protein
LQGGRAAQIRGDYVGWVDEGARVQFPGFGAYLSALDEFVNLLGRTVPELKGVGLSRQRAMIANYPAAGAVSSRCTSIPASTLTSSLVVRGDVLRDCVWVQRYARHVDNPVSKHTQSVVAWAL